MIRPTAPRSIDLFVLAVLCLLTQAAWQAPAPAAATAATRTLAQLRAALDEQIDMKEFQQPMTLKEALGLIQDKVNAKFKGDDVLPILIDAEAFKEENPDAPDIYDAQVKFPPFPRRMKAVEALKLALLRIPTKNAAFLLRGQFGFIEVTTVKRASLKHLLRQKVFINFERTPLADAVEELSALTGVSVVMDPRLGDKLKAPVTVHLNGEVPLDELLRLLANLVEVKFVTSREILYLTSPANAAALERERKAQAQQRTRHGAAEEGCCEGVAR